MSSQTLKGFRDFLPAEKKRRDFVARKITTAFQRFGFEPLETPTLESAELLLGKYGTEADKLVYTFTDKGERQVGLRYDQTVPTARALAQYQQQLPRYWRRYQIQNVFRADKPQKGRYREFTQCDIDIFGSTSPLADAEILACTYAAFAEIGFTEVRLKLNDRQTLMSTLQPFATQTVTVASIIQSIDKLDKQTPAQVVAELQVKGLELAAAEHVLMELKKSEMSSNLSEIVDLSVSLGVPKTALEFSPNLARGLDYYTGMIFEVMLPGFEAGSCGGGGRYDRLVHDLSGLEMPAVGIGFGFDRIVEAAETMGLLDLSSSTTQVLVAVFKDSLTASLETAAQLRAAGIATELYPAADKLGKQFKVADQKQIPFVVVVGEAEQSQNQVTLKNMATGDQTTLSLPDAIELLKPM